MTHSPKAVLLRLFPFLHWIGEVRPAALRQDLLAGLTVAVVLVPQSMAYAMLAGLPPHYGLYAAMVTPAIAALWGSLPQLATGPKAIPSLLVFTTLATLAQPQSRAYMDLVITLTFLIGGLYLAVGLLRAGYIMSFLSHAAIKGFTSAAALIIVSTQIPHVLGVTVPGHEGGFAFLIELIRRVPETNLPTLAVGVASLVVIRGIKLFRPHFPAALLVLVLSGLAVYFFGLDDHGVTVIGALPAGLPAARLPEVHTELIPTLLGPAAVIALVSFAETYSVDRAISDSTGYKVDVNQEFVGQGLANLVGALFQSLPVGGSFSRTAMAYAAGARTGLSSVISSVFVMIALLFLTPLLEPVPRATLGAVVISAVMLLFHPKQVFALWKKNRHDGVVAVSVFVLTLVVKPDYALLFGVILSLVLFLWVSMHPRIVRMAWNPRHRAYLNAEPLDAPCCPQMTILRVDNAIYFANAEYVVEQITQKVDAFREEVSAINDCRLKYLLLDFKGVGFIDITGIDELHSLLDELRGRDIGLLLVGVHQPVYEVFRSSGFLEDLGEERIFPSYDEALQSLEGHLDHDACCEECPYSALAFEDPGCQGPLPGARRREQGREC